MSELIQKTSNVIRFAPPASRKVTRELSRKWLSRLHSEAGQLDAGRPAGSGHA